MQACEGSEVVRSDGTSLSSAYLASVQEVALVGENLEALARVVRSTHRPFTVVAGGPGGDGIPLLEGRGPIDGRAAAYVCERFTCQAPVTDPEELERQLCPDS